MPSLFAASMTVAPLGTSTGRPSTSSLTGALMPDASCRRPLHRRLAHQAPLVADVVLELGAEVLDEALDRQCRRVPERADRPPRDVVCHLVQELQVLHPAAAGLDPVHHAVEPAGALAARRALPAGLPAIKIKKTLQAP